MARAAALRALLQLRRLRSLARLRLLCWLQPGIELHPEASPNLAGARFHVAPGGRLRIARGVVTEHRPGALSFQVGEGAELEVGDGVWLRTEIGPIHLAAHAGALLRIGPESILSGCQLSATRSIVLGRRAWVGPGSRVFDSDPHDLDAEHPRSLGPGRDRRPRLGGRGLHGAEGRHDRSPRGGRHALPRDRGRGAPHPRLRAAGRPRGKVGDRSQAR